MELARELRGEENMEKASEPDRVIGPDGITIASGSQFDPDRDDTLDTTMRLKKSLL